VTDRTGDRTGRKRQDGQQETGQTARDRTGKKDWVRCRAGQQCNGRRRRVAKQNRDRKHKQEWKDRTGGSEKKGKDRQERWDNTVQLRRTLVETHGQEFWNRYRNTIRMIKSEKFRRGQKGM
jgi:hypothetical protein